MRLKILEALVRSMKAFRVFQRSSETYLGRDKNEDIVKCEVREDERVKFPENQKATTSVVFSENFFASRCTRRGSWCGRTQCAESAT